MSRKMSDVPDDEALDPRIQVELERLNTCTDEINRLETELDEANSTFRSKLNEYTQKLDHLGNKLRRHIDKARPYYIAHEIARQAQVETQRVAVQYQRAVSTHQAAKETILLAEQRFLSKHEEWEFDAAWQEMLNHATIKVMEAETNKARSEVEHQKKAMRFREAKQRELQLEKNLRAAVQKSRPYFDLKETFQKSLEDLKDRVVLLQKAISSAKCSYSESLRNLEAISEQIHAQRRLTKPREPGVGAERDLPLPDIMLDEMDAIVKNYSMAESGSDSGSTAGDSAIHSPHSSFTAENGFLTDSVPAWQQIEHSDKPVVKHTGEHTNLRFSSSCPSFVSDHSASENASTEPDHSSTETTETNTPEEVSLAT